jgi:hypothetical protein
MRNRDIQTINDNIRALIDLKDDTVSAINKFQSDIYQIEHDLDRHFALTHIITKIKDILNNYDANTAFDFVDDIEAEASTLYYKYSTAEKANQVTSFRKVINPTFYNPKEF